MNTHDRKTTVAQLCVFQFCPKVLSFIFYRWASWQIRISLLCNYVCKPSGNQGSWSDTDVSLKITKQLVFQINPGFSFKTISKRRTVTVEWPLLFREKFSWRKLDLGIQDRNHKANKIPRIELSAVGEHNASTDPSQHCWLRKVSRMSIFLQGAKTQNVESASKKARCIVYLKVFRKSI